MSARSTFAIAVLAILALGASARAGDGPLVEAPLDVDVCAQPGGDGEPISLLKGGGKVNLAAARQDRWCQVYGTAVPGSKGWVWCGKGDDGQDYSLKAMSNSVPDNVLWGDYFYVDKK